MLPSPPSVRMKGKACDEAGLYHETLRLSAEATELLAHLCLEQSRAQQLQDTVVDAACERMRGRHWGAYLDDWTAVGAMPWVIA